MRVSTWSAAFLALVFLGAPGCAYRYKFLTGSPPAMEKKVSEWRHIGLWGWTEPAPFDLKKACPEGVAEFGSYVSVTNWACAFLTVGLYSPRTVYAVPSSRPSTSR